MGRNGAPLDAAVARVWSSAGRPVGTAFLAADDQLVTPAHVVNLALGRAPEAVVPPEAIIEVDFPLFGPGGRRTARVVRWVPPSRITEGSDDVAGLALDGLGPAGGVPLPLARVEHPFDRRVVMLGFPPDPVPGAAAGRYVVGRLRGAQADARVRIDVEDPVRFGTGFSGAPVWDVDAGVAVGMVVASVRPPRVVPAAALFAAWPRLSEQARLANPFPGLRTFREQDAASFCGRTELADRLDLLTRSAPVVTLLGPSGVGKSSLLHAGLLPNLRTRTDTLVAVTRPTDAATPLRSLALALERAGPSATDPAARAGNVSALTDRLRQGQLAEIVAALLARAGADRLVLVVDQLEEVFAGNGAGEIAEFGTVLTAGLDGRTPLAVVAALRADFLGETQRHPAIAPLVADPWLVNVPEPTRAELREAVTLPVERTHAVSYEPGLVDRLLDDAGVVAGRLPALQFTLATLWDREEEGRLPHSAYDEIGRLDQAPARHAEEVWAGLTPAERQAAEHLLVQLVRPVPDTTGFTRRAARRSELDPAAWVVAAKLATVRLVALRETEQTGDGPAFAAELGHDSLLTQWPRLAALVARHRDFRLWQETLRQRMRDWAGAGGPRAKLPGRADLRAAAQWTGLRAGQLSPGERDFLAAGRSRLRTAVVRAAAVAVVLVMVAGYFLVSREGGLATTAADDLAAKSVASHPAALRDPYGKVLLALRGYRTRHTDAAREAVESVGRSTSIADAVLPDYSASPSYDLTSKVSADGKVIVTTTADQKPAAFRIDGGSVGRIPLPPLPPLSFLTRAAVGARGTVAAYAGTVAGSATQDSPRTPCMPPEPDRVQTCVTAYDLRTGRVALEVPLQDTTLGGVTRLSVDATDQVVGALVEGLDGGWRVLRWRVGSGRALPTVTLAGTWDDVTGFWLAPGGELATVLQNPPAKPNRRGAVLAVLDLAGGPTRVLDDAVRSSSTVSASADGMRVASLVESMPAPTLKVWEVSTGRVLAHVMVPPEARSALGRGLALDPSGTRLALTWLPDLQAPPNMDAGSLASAIRDQNGTRVALFAVPDGRPLGTLRAAGGWLVVRPLGSSADSPVELSEGSLVALVLPNSAGDPGARLMMAAQTAPEPDAAYAALCAKLLDRTESGEVARARPEGAYTGDVCG